MNADAIFWERLADMPLWEAEQELVLRREGNADRYAELATKLAAAKRARRQEEISALGVALVELGRQNTLINERLGYVRRVLNQIHWRQAVRALLGEDAVEQCLIWLEQNYGHIDTQRRTWATKVRARNINRMDANHELHHA